MSALKSGELFAGVGGLGMAVDEVFGSDPAWFCEFDAAPSKVLAHHYPDVPNYGDVTKVDFTTVPHTHVRAGGFPCQDVSVSGARAGLRDGTRSGLWSEFARSIAEDRPDWVVIENVGGLLSAEAHSDVEPCPWCLGDEPGEPALRALGAVLADLAALGFDAEWTSIRASDVGAPHGRLRVFILAWPAERTVPDTSSIGRREGRPESARAAGRSDDELGGAVAGRGEPLLPGIVQLLPIPRTTDMNGAGAHGEGGHDLRTTVSLLPTPQVADATGGHATRSGDRADEKLLPGAAVDAATGWGPYAAAIARWEATIGRPAPSPVRMDGKGGKARLNPELTEWMMGWPDGWVTASAQLARAEQLKACGNGVVPQQAAAALRILLSRPGVPAVRSAVAA